MAPDVGLEVADQLRRQVARGLAEGQSDDQIRLEVLRSYGSLRFKLHFDRLQLLGPAERVQSLFDAEWRVLPEAAVVDVALRQGRLETRQPTVRRRATSIADPQAAFERAIVALVRSHMRLSKKAVASEMGPIDVGTLNRYIARGLIPEPPWEELAATLSKQTKL